MHNPKSVLEKKIHKLLWDFEIQTDHLLSVRQPYLVIVNKTKKKRTCRIADFAVPVDNRVQLNESENKDKYQDLVRELKKTAEHDCDGDTNCNWCSQYNPQRIGKRTWRLVNKRTSGDYPNYCIIKIGQNTKKSPWDMRILVVTQTPMENHQLTLVWKTLKEVTIIIVIIDKKYLQKTRCKFVDLVFCLPLTCVLFSNLQTSFQEFFNWLLLIFTPLSIFIFTSPSARAGYDTRLIF